MATGPLRLPPRPYPVSTFWDDIRRERALERALEVEQARYFQGLLAEAYRTGCFKKFWKAVRKEE